MKLSKAQRGIGISLAAALVLGATGVGIWQWSLESAATDAYASADSELRQANGERNRAASELNAARAEALASHTMTAQLAALVDPALLEAPALRDELTAANQALADAAELVADDAGLLTLPGAVVANRVPSVSAPSGRANKTEAAAKISADHTSLKRETEMLHKQLKAIETAAGATEAIEVALVSSAYAKGLATAVPEQAAQEAKDGFTAAVAALETPAQDADRLALLQAYQDAYAVVMAPTAPDANSAEGGPTYIRGILIANKTYALPSWWGDGLTGETLAAFDAMNAEASANGHSLYISSGFRSYDSQAAIYNSLVAQVGVAGADRDTARPGHSEHQTGLTIDLNCICEGFGYQADGQWVAANAHRFGFIVRYPQGKEHVTGYIWEPWHLRFLGIENATAVYNSGVSLEEYLGITSTYG